MPVCTTFCRACQKYFSIQTGTHVVCVIFRRPLAKKYLSIIKCWPGTSMRWGGFHAWRPRRRGEESSNATHLRTHGKGFADKEGGGGKKIQNYVNVISGSSLMHDVTSWCALLMRRIWHHGTPIKGRAFVGGASFAESFEDFASHSNGYTKYVL